MTIEVNDLLKNAMTVTGAKTYSECVDMALRMSLRAHEAERKATKSAKRKVTAAQKTTNRRRS